MLKCGASVCIPGAEGRLFEGHSGWTKSETAGRINDEVRVPELFIPEWLRGVGVRALSSCSVSTFSQVWRCRAVRLIEKIGVGDPVCSEMPEAIAQLTPSSKQVNGVCVADDHRPHHLFGLTAALVTVPDT